MAAQLNSELLHPEKLYRACVKDKTEISEDSRAFYLSQFLDLLPSNDDLLKRIWKQYVRTKPIQYGGNQYQLKALAYIYASRGDEHARIAFRRRTMRNLDVGKVNGVEEFLRIEREAGLQQILSRVDQPGSPVPDDDMRTIGYDVSEVFGEEWHREWADTNAATSRMARLVQEDLNRSYEATEETPIETLELLQAELKRDHWSYSAARNFSKHAPEQEFMEAAKSLPTDSHLLARQLKVFRYRPWPIELKPLFNLCHGYRWRVTRAAFKALQEIESAEVRQFALRHLGERYHGQLAVDLLKKNYRAGDEELIKQRADRSRWPEEMHSFHMTLRDLVEDHPEISDEYATYLYDTTPCSFCRYFVVKEMIRRDLITDAIRTDCLHDSEEDTRKLFAPTSAE